jgi:hypothetical protein
MWHVRPLKYDLVSLAVAPLSALKHHSQITLPLRFMTLQGVCTEFYFELEIIAEASLRPNHSLVIDEELHVFLDV